MPAIINENIVNPISWLVQYGDYLYAFAFSRLHDQVVAEDLVQETLLAALQSQQKFSQRFSEKTWLTAILKNKIIDYYRLVSRQSPFDFDEDDSSFFEKSGAWRDSLTDWSLNPESLLEQKEFRLILEECLAELPKPLSAVFTLREIEGLETKEICELLDLSPNNFWIMLYRARLQLRRTIENKWFIRRDKRNLLNRTKDFAFSN